MSEREWITLTELKRYADDTWYAQYVAYVIPSAKEDVERNTYVEKQKLKQIIAKLENK